jgi:hypothetical protein
MNTEKLTEYLTRDSLLKLLSDAEIGSVSTAETATRLADGDEYLDLEHLARGVQRAPRVAATMGQLLPRKAVRDATWNAILARLPAVKVGPS